MRTTPGVCVCGKPSEGGTQQALPRYAMKAGGLVTIRTVVELCPECTGTVRPDAQFAVVRERDSLDRVIANGRVLLHSIKRPVWV